VVHDTISFVRGILETEMNSATDNPMILAEQVSNRNSSSKNNNFSFLILWMLFSQRAMLCQVVTSTASILRRWQTFWPLLFMN